MEGGEDTLTFCGSTQVTFLTLPWEGKCSSTYIHSLRKSGTHLIKSSGNSRHYPLGFT